MERQPISCGKCGKKDTSTIAAGAFCEVEFPKCRMTNQNALALALLIIALYWFMFFCCL